jgi:putative spermidine/putrescine transport system substrate-binding protein/spermidine/putrescine transport system substrate-binding protein
MAALLMVAAMALSACGAGSGNGKGGGTADSAGNGGQNQAGGGGQLNLLVWEGYADPSFVADFEKQYNVKVNAAYMGSSDELVAKLKGGGDAVYDIISPSSDVTNLLIDQGLVSQIDTSKIKTYGELSQKLKDLPLVKKDGKTYGVPFAWGPDPLIYDANVFKTPPDSISVLWDPQYKGKVSVWDDISTVYLAAHKLGYQKPDPAHVYNMTDAELANVKKELQALKPQIRKYWATGGELTNLFANGEVVVAVGWPLTTQELKKMGKNVGELIPKEGTTGWIDNLMIPASSKNKDLAMKWIEYVTGAQTMKKVADVTNYSVANPGATKYMTPEQAKALYMDNPDVYFNQINFWQNVPRRDKYNELWNEVKS